MGKDGRAGLEALLDCLQSLFRAPKANRLLQTFANVGLNLGKKNNLKVIKHFTEWKRRLPHQISLTGPPWRPVKSRYSGGASFISDFSLPRNSQVKGTHITSASSCQLTANLDLSIPRHCPPTLGRLEENPGVIASHL